MANIKVNDIKPAGAELFGDSESFMKDLSDSEMNNLVGGARRGGGGAETSVFLCCFVNRDRDK
jgi:hypothetical protein